MRDGGGRPSMFSVAARAGVSHQTVSRVVNGAASVRPETRERVEQAIRELGYQPNQSARALATRRSRLVGVIFAGGSHFGPVSTVAAIEEAARREGYATLVSVADGIDGAGLRELFRSFRGRDVDAMLVVAPHQALGDAARAAADLVPTVVIGAVAESAPFSVVAVDQREGAARVTRHLLERGARQIAHLAGPGEWFDARARVEGWRAALAEAGVEPGPLLQGDWTAERAYTLASDLVDHTGRTDLPDAVVCANDLSAIGVLAALRARGVRVPEDVRVTGFDDLDGAAFSVPPLTTVRQPFAELGRRAMAAALRAGGGEASGVELLEPELVVRVSG